MRKCKHCLLSFDITDKPVGWMANHSRWCDKNPARNKEKSRKIKPCSGCSKEYTGRNKFCSIQCKSENFKHSEEAKKKISRSRKQYLEENPDKHVWKKTDKFKSVPCQILKDYLAESNIPYVEEWRPLDDRFFSIDIAFPDLKIGIEVNGNQHYDQNGNLLDYYQNRHDLITESGWKLYEIHYTSCFRPAKLMEDIKLGKQRDYTEYFRKKIEKVKIPIKQQNLMKNLPITEKIESSDIDFSKFGWVKEAAKIIGISDQKVGSWMHRNMPEFYENRCFKRKSKS